MYNDFSGRLEKVRITGKEQEQSAVGELSDGTWISVFNGYGRQGDCLVRVDFPDVNSRGKLRGNFISSSVPENFQSLDQRDFVLYGEWNKETMRELNPDSIFEDVNPWFNAGTASWMPYIGFPSNDSNRGLLIYKDHSSVLTGNLPKVVGFNLPDSDMVARVILIEANGYAKALKYVIKKQGFTPIKMEPLQ